jgi:hypothetical protein
MYEFENQCYQSEILFPHPVMLEQQPVMGQLLGLQLRRMQCYDVTSCDVSSSGHQKLDQRPLRLDCSAHMTSIQHNAQLCRHP